MQTPRLRSMSAHAFGRGQNRPKHHVLHDRQLCKHFSSVHFHHTVPDFAPRFCSQNIVKHGQVPPKTCFFVARNGFNAVDEMDALQIHVSAPIRLDQLAIVDQFGFHMRVGRQSCRPKEKWKKMVIVQAPNTVRTCGFKPICFLEAPHHGHVLVEHHNDECLVVRRFKNANLFQAVEKAQEVEFVPRPVINTRAVPPGLGKIAAKLLSVVRGHCRHQQRCFGADSVVKAPELGFSEPGHVFVAHNGVGVYNSVHAVDSSGNRGDWSGNGDFGVVGNSKYGISEVLHERKKGRMSQGSGPYIEILAQENAFSWFH
ncbi:hypothetical protein CLUG_02947 [Clavispora lusitaniae ATCC 42720]|uniref:Uncharacterized protein n=1 Tax=Clavispora lusitaniae (strain ATCC 42720) TaxID=306902 RepID=C4Y334_CLAL4|nr:uncharacterized protein CLUG_02947 [Clavispora lusitaniae ATCC 42720]EEQ38820.1 hypothetical protein CLUG_02947 [Clavispora lusitaniae ATCC 42720]